MNNESKMSVTQLTILTAVNMMGSGIIMLPAKLAEVGGLSIVSWLVTAIGSMCLAYVFAKCGMYSRKQGGMNGYAEYTFGKSGIYLQYYLQFFLGYCEYCHRDVGSRLRFHFPGNSLGSDYHLYGDNRYPVAHHIS